MLYNPDCFCSLSVDIGIRGRGAKEAEELEGWGREGGRGGSGSHRDPTEEKGEGRGKGGYGSAYVRSSFARGRRRKKMP